MWNVNDFILLLHAVTSLQMWPSNGGSCYLGHSIGFEAPQRSRDSATAFVPKHLIVLSGAPQLHLSGVACKYAGWVVSGSRDPGVNSAFNERVCVRQKRRMTLYFMRCSPLVSDKVIVWYISSQLCWNNEQSLRPAHGERKSNRRRSLDDCIS
ncbi:hypothetical protein OE88DRAFT_805492 [Heliocybe sulcata]|uniref:Secreted protein n=1 Tax=Heliocybe sulcata TaxID=5364 RepID=A0A5C3MUI5_9AGAM|nr:hypothetical protein OE88DRAFT_805492 [Heliocybe sulcata]